MNAQELDNIDLIRRYAPHVTQHTHEDIAKHIAPDASGCWHWDGHITQEGYGVVSCEPTPYGLPQTVRIHRYMYDLIVGKIPYGYHIHHRCEHRACWHPLHLQALTPKEHLAAHAHI